MATTFVEGDVVRVVQRQWPGVNKQGGIARVLKVNADATIAVTYVVGGGGETAVSLKVRQRLTKGGTGGVIYRLGCLDT